MDVVYVVREGRRNRELLYSLRSLANVPHDRVWIVGYRPPWVSRDVGYLPTITQPTKYETTTQNVATACGVDDISDPFMLWNDDFYAMKPTDVPFFHRGPVDSVVAEYRSRDRVSGPYVVGMGETASLLRAMGFDMPLSYELHIPIVVHKPQMMEALHIAMNSGIEIPHKRTIYGNLADLPGKHIPDVKILNDSMAGYENWAWLSTDDWSFKGRVGRYVAQSLQVPGPYERLVA